MEIRRVGRQQPLPGGHCKGLASTRLRWGPLMYLSRRVPGSVLSSKVGQPRLLYCEMPTGWWVAAGITGEAATVTTPGTDAGAGLLW